MWPSLVFGQLTPQLQDGSYESHVYNYYTGRVNPDDQSFNLAGRRVSYLKPEDYEWFEDILRLIDSPETFTYSPLILIVGTK